MAAALVLLGVGFLFMVAGARRGDGGALVSPWWLVAAYTFHTFGELCLSPIGLSLVTKLTPAKFAAVTMGFWFLSTGIAELLAGQIAAITDKVGRGELFHLFGGQADFYFIFVALSAATALVLRRALPLASPAHARSRFVKVVAAAFCLLLSSIVSGAPADPYRWLEDGDAPAVARWTEAQNAATRKALDHLPGRAALEGRLGRLYAIGSLGAPVSRPHAAGQAAASQRKERRYFYTRRDGAQNQAVLYVRDGLHGADRSLVDVNRERADGTRALDWWFPSDDGGRVAYGISDDGSEESLLRVRDVEQRTRTSAIRSRARAPARSPGCRTAAASTTRATRSRARCRPARSRITAASSSITSATIRRTISRSSATAAIAPTGPASISRPTVAGWWSASRRGGPRARSTSSTCTRPAATGAPSQPIAVATGEDARFDVVEALDDRIYLLTTSGAPRGRIFAVDAEASGARPLARGGPRGGRRARARGLFPRRARRRLSARRCRAPASLRHRSGGAQRRGSAAGARRADGALRRARRRRAVLRVHRLLRADHDLRASSWAPRRRASSGARSRRRSIRRRSRSSG